jgi:parallel beta-helix repeat protein
MAPYLTDTTKGEIMVKSKFPFLAMFTLLISVLAFSAQHAVAATGDHDDDDNDDHYGRPGILVDNDRVQCPNAQYTSIQAAVTAAPAGATISVCPGTYPETVRINKPLTIRGIRVGNENLVLINPAIAAANTTSLYSGDPTAAIILVEKTVNVTLDNLTVDGSANTIPGCAPSFVGVFYRNASGRISNAVVRNIRLNPLGLGGCQDVNAIFAESGTLAGVKRGARLEVFGTSVHDYQKTGIVGNEEGTVLIASGNTVSGIGATTEIAQNGIQIGFGARGEIKNNSVINHIYSPCTTTSSCSASSSNILVFTHGSGIEVSDNNFGKSQVNVYFGTDGDGPLTNGSIEDNTIFQSDVYDGIYLEGNYNSVRGNRIFNSSEASVYVVGSRNRITNNTFNEAPVGVFVDGGTNNQISGNFYFNIEQRVVPPSAAPYAPFSALQVMGGEQGRKVQPVRP